MDGWTGEFREVQRDGEIDDIHGTTHHDGWIGYRQGQIDHSDGSLKGTFVGNHNPLRGVFGANHDHLKDRMRKLHVDDGAGIDENDLEIRVRVHDDGGILFDGVKKFRFLLRARFGQGLVQFGRWLGEQRGRD